MKVFKTVCCVVLFLSCLTMLLGVDKCIPESRETPIFEPNPNAKADAFRLYYRERTDRLLESINRFALTGDVSSATIINKMYIAKQGRDYEVIPGPVDNNAHGYTTFATWKLYQAMGGRRLELTLIRMFEGLAFYEEVTGHRGLTVREALPGWTREVDGDARIIERRKNGQRIEPPVRFSAELENEILDTFFKGVKITYRENPEDFFYNFKPVNELEDYATTYVFDHIGEPLEWIPISNCCSSFMKTQAGPWAGLAWWGNHNSRDNFSDYVMGYLAAFEAEKTPGLPADLARAAKHAADAGRHVGDTTTSHGNILMTVDERSNYFTLSPAGQVGPDGRSETEDLGSIDTCQMAYLAKAVSTGGLHLPVPKVPLPGFVPRGWLNSLLKSIGMPVKVGVSSCRRLDDTGLGITFGQFLNHNILGKPWYEHLKLLTYLYPDIYYEIIEGTMDDLQEFMLTSVGIVYYARVTGDAALYKEAHASLNNIIKLQTILVKLVFGDDGDPRHREFLIKKLGKDVYEQRQWRAKEILYKVALYERMFGFDSPLKNLDGFVPSEAQIAWAVSPLNWSDTKPEALMSNETIQERIANVINGKKKDEPWIYERYVKRFFDSAGNHHPPVRSTSDGYEFLDQNDQWRKAEIPHHAYFGGLHYWKESALAVWSKQTLDCEWARLGCKPADLNDSGTVDTNDTTIFVARWNASGGEGAKCPTGCGGADLDRDGMLDKDDRDYMQAAQGCYR